MLILVLFFTVSVAQDDFASYHVRNYLNHSGLPCANFYKHVCAMPQNETVVNNSERYYLNLAQQLRSRSLNNPVMMAYKRQMQIEECAAKQRSVNKEDLLSGLFDDCLLDILTRIDHNDHDEIATLSSKLCRLSDFSRSRAMPIKCHRLAVTQRNSKEFHFKIFTNYSFCGDVYFLKMISSETGHFSKKKFIGYYEGFFDLPQQQEMSEVVVTRTSDLFNRFDFKEYIFYSISIDDHFLTYFEKFCSSHTIFSFKLLSCALDKNLSEGGKDKLISILFSSNLSYLSLHFRRDTAPFVDVHFLCEYAARKVHLPGISIQFESRYPNVVPNISPDEKFEEVLSRFGCLEMRNLLINSDWLLSSIMKRLRHTGCGYWEFQATRMIDISEIENSLTTDLEYIHVNKRHCIRIVGTEHHVFFNVERSEYHGNRLMLISNFREGPIDCWLLQSPNS